METRSPRLHPRGFTLTEILVVIVLIILLLGLAVPAFNLMKGSRSVDAAENQISALIGRARADAIGLGTPHGVIFFIDPNSFPPGGNPLEGRVIAAEVTSVDPPINPARDVYLDRVPETDHLNLPAGVLVMTLNNGGVDRLTKARTSDAYLGFNPTISTGTTQYQANANWPVFIGGVILFGGNGELISRTWGYSAWDAANGRQTAIATELGLPGSAGTPFIDAGPNPPPTLAQGDVPRSSLGMALFDMATFRGDPSRTIIDCQMRPVAYDINELNEETWIDENSTPLLVNRFNGTLVRGE